MWNSASPELIEAALGRRGQIRLRVITGLVVALAMGPIVGWGVTAAWLLAWYLVQYLEFSVSQRAERRVRAGRGFPAAPILALMSLANFVFGAMAVLGGLTTDSWSMTAGAWILAGALLNAAATSGRSRAAFYASAAPAAALCFTTPLWGHPHGPSNAESFAIFVGALLLVVATFVLRRVALKAIYQAQEASAAKTTFLANISHEVRTPLNGILGMAQVMASGDLAAEQRERLEVVQRSGAALLSVLNDVLDLSKVEAGKLELEDGHIHFEQLASDLEQSFRALAAAKDLVITVNVAPSARGWWRGDPVRVRQILSNLISNAVKFTDCGTVDVQASYAAPWLSVVVADTGVGMSPDALSKLFSKFMQADASTTRKYGGTGLGLAICRELTALMGGDIEVESAPGLGSRFRLRLPLTQTEAPAHEGSVASVELDRGLRVLVAEDHETNRAVLKLFLDQLGADSGFVTDGAQAVEAAASRAWDVILMDVQMPVLDGVEAVRLIRGREAQEMGERVPIIALTANAMSHHAAEYLAIGMDAIVAKPVDFSALVRTLGEVTARPGEALVSPASDDIRRRVPV